MANVKYKVNIDLEQNELIQARVENLGTEPVSPVVGQIYYDTGINRIGVYTGGNGWLYMDDGVGTITDVQAGTGGIDVNVVGGIATVSLLAASSTQDGYMSSDDKEKLDGSTSAATPNTLVERDNDGIISVSQITITDAPVNPTDGVNKQYVDNLAQGLKTKQPARAVATDEITLSGTQTVDDVSLNTGDRVLVIGQSTLTENGVYLVDSGAWSRVEDFDIGFEAAAAYLFIEEGTNFADTGWVCVSNTGSDVVGTDNIEFVQFSKAGVIQAGQGLTKVGNIINAIAGDDSITINPDDFTVNRDADGAIALNGADGIGVNTDGTFIKIDGNQVTIGNGTTRTVFENVTLGTQAGTQTITHNLGTLNLHSTVIDVTSGEKYIVDISYVNINEIEVSANGPAVNVRVIISGAIGVEL